MTLNTLLLYFSLHYYACSAHNILSHDLLIFWSEAVLWSMYNCCDNVQTVI